MIKNGDFVELDYTGKLKDDGVFDTTDKDVAQSAGIFSEKAEYSPVVICVGEHQILPAIDEFLIGREQANFTLELSAEKAFGKKNAELIKVVSANNFTAKGIKPFPGLQLNIDDHLCTVKAVSGGRIVVDFNHPLSGRDVVYELKIKGLITDKKLQVESILKSLFGIRAPVEIIDNKARIALSLPDEIKDKLVKRIEKLTGIAVSFEKPEQL